MGVEEPDPELFEDGLAPFEALEGLLYETIPTLHINVLDWSGVRGSGNARSITETRIERTRKTQDPFPRTRIVVSVTLITRGSSIDQSVGSGSYGGTERLDQCSWNERGSEWSRVRREEEERGNRVRLTLVSVCSACTILNHICTNKAASVGFRKGLRALFKNVQNIAATLRPGGRSIAPSFNLAQYSRSPLVTRCEEERVLTAIPNESSRSPRRIRIR